MIGNIVVFLKRIIRCINRLLPSGMRRQLDIPVVYGECFFRDPYYRYLNDSQIEAFCDFVMEILSPGSVVDMGCGLAYYLSYFKKRGINVVGFDASHYAIRKADVSVPVYVADLTRPFISNQKFDVVICFEVAEHLPMRASNALIGSLCALGDVILFTAAALSQPGIDHINLQAKSFWFNLFNHNGFAFDNKLTNNFLDNFRKIGVPEWFCRNFSVFRKQ